MDFDFGASNQTPNIPVAVKTLTLAGYIVEKATRNPGYLLLHTIRYDEFGKPIKYCFLISEEILTDEQINGGDISAKHENAIYVIVGNGDSSREHITWEDFINLFGGAVNNTDPLEPDFTNNLELLGHNKLPETLSGTADDLFELYANVALEFILGGKVVRYGQARRFEERPDGIALPSRKFTALYDAKAYKDGYDISLNTIRQFESYVSNFNEAYSSWYKLNSFILISGHFNNEDKTIESRSRELLAKSGIPLSCLNTKTLSNLVSIFKEKPLLRRSIDWVKIFTNPIVDSKEVEKQIMGILKDKVVKG